MGDYTWPCPQSLRLQLSQKEHSVQLELLKMSFFSRVYDFEKFLGIPREKFPNSQFFPFPWEKKLGGKTETLISKYSISKYSMLKYLMLKYLMSKYSISKLILSKYSKHPKK